MYPGYIKGYTMRDIRRKKFSAHKASAKQRGIPFSLTFDEWWLLWEASGHFDKPRWMMTRRDNQGGYVLGNVEITTGVKNATRGLGKLQRFIKEQIYRAEREYKREAVALSRRRKVKPDFDSFKEGMKAFWLTWPHIRYLIEENPDLNPGPYRISPSLERSAKRALHLLVKRGEIVRMKDERYLNRYITNEMDQSLRQTGKAIMEGFARMEKEGGLS